MGEHCAGGENFDEVDAIVGQLANSLADFPGTVGLSVVKIPGQLDVGSLSGHGAGAAGDRNVGAGDEHARAGYVASGDGVAQGHIVKGAIGTDVAHRGETGVEHLAGIGHRLKHDLGGGFAQDVEGFAVAVAVGNVGVAIDQVRGGRSWSRDRSLWFRKEDRDPCRHVQSYCRESG